MAQDTTTIHVLSYDGDPQGIVCIKDSHWQTEMMYFAPRASTDKLTNMNVCDSHGVYLLLSQDKVFIGQSTDLPRDLSHHTNAHTWWDTIAILTDANNGLSSNDAKYLQNVLVRSVYASGRLDIDCKRDDPELSDNKRRGYLNRIIEEALFLLAFRGITVFQKSHGSNKPRNDAAHSASTVSSIRPPAGERLRKSVGVKFIREHGINVTKNTTFASLQPDAHFWANPNISLLKTDWHIILNDSRNYELVVLLVPANTLAIRRGGRDGLVSRTDKPLLIDLSIDQDTLKDRRSGTNFSRFVIARIPY